MGDSNKNLKILKELGLDEWFMYSEKFQPFFKWFGENITEATTFKESDLREFGDLKDDGAVLVDSALERYLKQYEADLSIILNGKQEIQQLLEDIELASQVDKAVDGLISDIKKTNVKIQQNLGNTHLIAKRLKNEEESQLRDCMIRSKELQELQQENITKMKEVYRFYSTDHLSPVFIHQMGMNQSYQHCDSFVKITELYLDNNFKLEHPSDLDLHDQSAHEQAIVDLDKIKMKMFMSSLELSRQQMFLSAQKSLNAAIQCDWQALSMSAMDKEAMEMHRKNEDYYKIQTEAALDSLKFVLRQLASLEVETAAFENTRAKHGRATERLQQMKAIYSVVFDDLVLTEVLWLLVQFDVEKLRQKSQWNILDQYQTENRSTLRRIEIMRQASRSATEPLAELISGPILLLANLNDTGDTNPLGLYDKLLQNVSDNLKSLGSKKSERSFIQFIENIRNQESKLRKFVQSGPVSNLVLCDLSIQNALFTIKSSMKEIEYRNSDFRANYVKTYAGPMNNNQFLQSKYLLWIWFLTEPKTVIRALKSIQLAAKDSAARCVNRPTKTVSGIKRRD